MDRNRSSFLSSAFTRGAGLLTSRMQRHQTLGGGGYPTQVCWSSVQSPGHIIKWHVNYSSQFTLAYAPQEGAGGGLSILSSLGSLGWVRTSCRSDVTFLKGFHESVKKQPLAT